jgi:hypothetical protein
MPMFRFKITTTITTTITTYIFNRKMEVAVVQMILELTGGVEHTSSSSSSSSTANNNNKFSIKHQ